MNVRYIVELTEEERDTLELRVSSAKTKPRSRLRGQVLLAAGRGVGDADIKTTLGVGLSTIYRLKKAFVEGGLSLALRPEQRAGGVRKLTGNEEALLVAMACSKPPEGRASWTLALLADKMVELTDHTSVSPETVRRRLSEKKLKPWQKKMWCIPAIDAEYVTRMEDVLDLYAEPADPARPVVCFDETPIQLIGDTRVPRPPKPGRAARWDYEYKRNGTANLFVFVDAHRSWRHVDVTLRRTAIDFAQRMRDLVDVHYPEASCIRVVLDNLSTHAAKNLYEAFPPEEARRILRRLEFHFTPKHASWLNMVEIEISVLAKQCLARRIPDLDTLRHEVGAWLRARTASGARIHWLFTTDLARTKLAKSYPAHLPPHAKAA
jgi:transposase